MLSEEFEDIQKYGGEVLRSSDFQEAMTQKHHYHSTVGQHSLDVAFIALGIAILLRKFNVNISVRALVIGCLCHDLGILDRGRFSSGSDMCRRHPVESAELSKKYAKGDDIVYDMCLHHMYPLMTKKPETAEGWIISVADKISSVGEVVFPPVRRKWEKRNSDVFAA